jgi:hypothetical protein
MKNTIKKFQIQQCARIYIRPLTNKWKTIFLEHVFKKMSSIEIVPLSVCPSVRLFPIFSTFMHLESWKFEYKLRTIYLPGVRPEFSIRGLEVLGLGPEPDPLQIWFFVSFWTKIFSNLGFLSSIPWQMVFALVSDRFQPAPNSEVRGSWPNHRVQIFPPDYLGTYAL